LKQRNGIAMATEAEDQPNRIPAGGVRDFAKAAECLRVLAHPVRLRILRLLLVGRFSVGELAEDCGIENSVASDHLRLLQRCGFLVSQRDGRKVYYLVAEPHLMPLMACLEGGFGPELRPARKG
jgi:ArsR family transcriptional regulator, zinc-responsive transcriptional repressor